MPSSTVAKELGAMTCPEPNPPPDVLEKVPAAVVTKLKVLSVRFIEIITGNVQIDKVIGGKSHLLK